MSTPVIVGRYSSDNSAERYVVAHAYETPSAHIRLLCTRTGALVYIPRAPLAPNAKPPRQPKPAGRKVGEQRG